MRVSLSTEQQHHGWAPNPFARASRAYMRRKLTSPSAVLVGATAIQNLLRLVSAVILTRILSPEAYGTIAIIMSFFFVITMLTDTGCQAFIIRHTRGLESVFLDAVWTIHVFRGLGSALIAVALAFPVAYFLARPELAILIGIASISLLIDGFVSLSLMTALRTNMVQRLSLLDVFVAAIQFVVAIAAALMLESVWALIIAIITASLVRTLGSYILFPKAVRRFRVDLGITKELWSFSRVIVASSALTLVISQLDRVILAKVMPISDFGVYAVAGTLATAPIVLVHVYTSRILYPMLANVWRTAPTALLECFYASRGIVTYTYLAATGVLIGSAPLVVQILYDPRYEQAGVYVRLLTISTALLMLTKPMNELMVASGRARMTLEMNIVRIAWLVTVMPIGFLNLQAGGVVAALGLVEVPAYLYGSYRLAQSGLYDPSWEIIAFGTIGAGVVAGLVIQIAAPMATALFGLSF